MSRRPNERSGDNTRSRRATRDPEEAEDDDMLRNPRDHPYPAFLPTQSLAARQRVQAEHQIELLVKATVPIVPFKNTKVPKAPWSGTSQFVRHEYVPDLDKLASHEEPPPPPTLSHPKWLNIIPRAVSGCPQLGLPMHFEMSGKEKANTGRRQRKQAAANALKAQEGARGQRVSKMVGKYSNTPRFLNKHKDDLVADILADEKMQHCVRDSVGTKREDGELVVVSLPRIGPRMFVVSSPRRSRSPSHAGTPRVHVPPPPLDY